MTELLDGVHRIEAQVAGRPLYLFLFLGDRRLLLDAGCSTTVGDSILPYLRGLDLGVEDLDLLVITHSDLDHQGGPCALARESPRLLVTCGALDRELVSDPEALVSQRYSAYLEHGIGYGEDALAWIRAMSGEAQAVDVGLAGGETIRLGPGFELRVLHVPGHSPGHLALHDERSGAVFAGDCVQGSVYLDFLAETRDYVERLDGLACECLSLAPAGLTLRELIERCNERLPEPWAGDAAQELVFSLHGHLHRFVVQGKVSVARDGDRPIFRWRG